MYSDQEGSLGWLRMVQENIDLNVMAKKKKKNKDTQLYADYKIITKN